MNEDVLEVGPDADTESTTAYVNPDVDHELVRKLADLNGVATYFWTWGGSQQQVEPGNLLRVLEAMGVAVSPAPATMRLWRRSALLKTHRGLTPSPSVPW